MAKATTYSFQGKEWSVKDLAEELDLSTHRVYRLLKDHNEDIKAIFESRGITIKEEEKSQRARLFEYKGKQWTVKQLSEEFGLSYARVNHLIRQYDGDVEQIALSREKRKKADPTKKAPKTGKSVEKNQNKNNLFKVKLSYELNDELIEESININQFSSLNDKIYSIIDNFKNKSDDEYFICEIYYCSESEEDLIWELEIDDYENFIVAEAVSGIQFFPKLFKHYDLNFFHTLEMSFEEFFKRLTGEKEKQIQSKRVEIIYETENNSYEEDVGVVNNLDELKKLINNCDLYKYSSSFYQGDDQGSYSVGFNIYLENQILGSLKWYTNDKSLDDFLGTENDFDPLHNELVEYYEMVFFEYTNKNLANFIFQL